VTEINQQSRDILGNPVILQLRRAEQAFFD
jgi:hypothetical protein